MVTFLGAGHSLIRENTIQRCSTIKKTKKDFILPAFSNILHTVHFSRMLAPYTIFPIKNDLRLSLISGDYLLYIQINISGLARWLEKRGWQAKVLQLPDKAPVFSKPIFIPMLQVREPKNSLGVEIPLDVIAGAAMELWMPESIESTIQAVINSGYSNTAYTVNFPNTGKYAWD